MRRAFTIVALANVEYLLPGRQFLIDAFIKELRDLGPELYDLEVTGMLAHDEQVPGGWRVRPQIMLWWLADELIRALRGDTSFGDWLRAQELDGLLTRREREQMVGIVQGLRQGQAAFLEGFAKGLGIRVSP
jgi:hypothetical protein